MSRILFLMLVVGTALIRVAVVFTISRPGIYTRTLSVSRVPQERSGTQYLEIEGRSVALPQKQTVYLGDTVVLQTKEDSTKVLVTDMKVSKSNNFLYKLRQDFIDYVIRNSPSPFGEVLLGIVIGARDILSTKESYSIKQAGVTHLLIASGTNISFIVLCGLFFLRPRLGRLRSIPFVLVFVWLYVLLVGFEPAIVRAACTFSFISLLSLVGLAIPTAAVLVWVFLFFIIVTPTVLTDIGFYLSFSAVAGILFFDAHLYRLLRFIPVNFIRKSISTSLSASVAVAPVSLFVFKTFPLITIISTLLVSWVTMPILVLTPLSYFLSFLNVELGNLALLFCFPLANYFLFVAKTLSVL